MKMMKQQRICACGKPILARQNKYCEMRCSARAGKTATCKRCGVEFSRHTKGGASRKDYCSRDCSFAMMREKRQSREKQIEAAREERQKARLERIRTKTQCRLCNNTRHGFSRLCHLHWKEKARAYYRIRAKQWKQNNPGKLEAQRRRRRLKAEANAEFYLKKDIFKRDKWVCWLCNQPTDKTKKFPHPDSPVIDHVIPIAKGGADIPDNVACAHFSCNASKRDVVVSLF